MFRLVVLSTVLAVAVAAPHAPLVHTSVVHQPALVAHKEISYQKSIIEEPTVAHVGTVVKHVPTGVTHHSSSVVHHDATISEPILAHGVKKTVVSTPIEKTTYHHTVAAAPAISYAAPAIKTAYVETAPALTYAAAPIAKAAYVHATPALTYAAAPIAKAIHVEAAPALTYAAAPALTYATAPIAKAIHVEAAPVLSHAAHISHPAVYAKHY
ncbi:cuticle protein 16.5-like [Toxorhynchites rutilus septentrionalis]|uniref:cuticle protein 16.5-like n=1 Tax=Toxorhynchites rutilus septentrionalis TaxID=329112 RepID=UPI0024794A8F|nr:cuticle protein 16.5-like [Toxorhynchites rutilus septentrionalis]